MIFSDINIYVCHPHSAHFVHDKYPPNCNSFTPYTTALIIQRNARFFFGMKRWRRWKREKIMKVVRRYAAYAQEKALKNVLARTLKKHSDNMRRPQALVRGYLLRNVMKNARWVAYMMGRFDPVFV